MTFGSQPALAIAVISSSATETVLSITPPSYECASCSYEAGVATVDLAVQTLNPEPQNPHPKPKPETLNPILQT